MTNRECVMIYAQMYQAHSDDPAKYKSETLTACHTALDKNKEFSHIPFYSVGHNSSHSFYLGVDEQDNVYYRSYSYYDEQINRYPDCDHKSDECICYEPENFKSYESDRIEKLSVDIKTTPIYMGHW